MKTTLLLAALMATSSVMADSIQLPMLSKHFNPGDYNEVNPGLVYERDLTQQVSVLAGGYRNSFRKTTLLVGLEAQYGNIGVQGALATGYEQIDGNKLQFTGTIFGELPLTDNFAVRLSVIPHKHGAVATSIIVSW